MSFPVKLHSSCKIHCRSAEDCDGSCEGNQMTTTDQRSEAAMNQLSINFASAAGETAANACTAKAQRSDPEFSAKAKTAILAHLRAVGRASGEDLVNVAIVHGARPHDARAFGSVFQSLSRAGMIRTIGFCLREKGHGTAGGRIWSINL